MLDRLTQKIKSEPLVTYDLDQAEGVTKLRLRHEGIPDENA